MKGRSIRLSMRVQVAALFAVMFVVAAVAVFALTSAAGAALHIAELPLSWRRSIAGVALLALAAADLLAVRRRTYCPLSWRRQTPRALMRRFPPRIVASLWGLDTGLAITTFRVSAATWAALVLTFLGFGTWWIGVCYGVAFVVPLMAVIWLGPVGNAAVAPDPLDPGLDRLLRSRPFAQVSSALLLCICALIVLAFALAVTELAMAR